MDNLQDKPMPADNLPEWHRSRDPLRYRQGLSAVQYATPMQRFERARRFVPDSVFTGAGIFVLGVVFAMLFIWGWAA